MDNQHLNGICLKQLDKAISKYALATVMAQMFESTGKISPQPEEYLYYQGSCGAS